MPTKSEHEGAQKPFITGLMKALDPIGVAPGARAIATDPVAAGAGLLGAGAIASGVGAPSLLGAGGGAAASGSGSGVMGTVLKFVFLNQIASLGTGIVSDELKEKAAAYLNTGEARAEASLAALALSESDEEAAVFEREARAAYDALGINDDYIESKVVNAQEARAAFMASLGVANQNLTKLPTETTAEFAKRGKDLSTKQEEDRMKKESADAALTQRRQFVTGNVPKDANVTQIGQTIDPNLALAQQPLNVLKDLNEEEIRARILAEQRAKGRK